MDQPYSARARRSGWTWDIVGFAEGRQRKPVRRCLEVIRVCVSMTLVLVSLVTSLRSPALVPIALLRRVLPYLVKLGSPSLRRRIVDLVPFKSLQTVKSIIDVLDSNARRIVAKKLATVRRGDEAGDGKDILSRLGPFSGYSCLSKAEERFQFVPMRILPTRRPCRRRKSLVKSRE